MTPSDARTRFVRTQVTVQAAVVVALALAGVGSFVVYYLAQFLAFVAVAELSTGAVPTAWQRRVRWVSLGAAAVAVALFALRTVQLVGEAGVFGA